MIVSVQQPSYLPGIRIFHQIMRSDIHIIYDNAQISKDKYGNQSRCNFPDGYHNISKIKHSHKESINKVMIKDLNNVSLSIFNSSLIVSLSRELGLKTKFVFASDLDIPYKNLTATDKLVEMVKCVGGDIYLSGPGGKNYLDYDRFKSESIGLKFSHYPNDDYFSILYHISQKGLDTVKKELYNGYVEDFL